MTRRITTGLVPIALASTSDVTGTSPLRHVQQDVEHAGELHAGSHVTSDIT